MAGWRFKERFSPASGVAVCWRRDRPGGAGATELLANPGDSPAWRLLGPPFPSPLGPEEGAPHRAGVSGLPSSGGLPPETPDLCRGGVLPALRVSEDWEWTGSGAVGGSTPSPWPQAQTGRERSHTQLCPPWGRSANEPGGQVPRSGSRSCPGRPGVHGPGRADSWAGERHL